MGKQIKVTVQQQSSFDLPALFHSTFFDKSWQEKHRWNSNHKDWPVLLSCYHVCWLTGIFDCSMLSCDAHNVISYTCAFSCTDSHDICCEKSKTPVEGQQERSQTESPTYCIWNKDANNNNNNNHKYVMKQNSLQCLSWYPENTWPLAKTASGKHQYPKSCYQNVRISTDCLPRNCLKMKNNLGSLIIHGASKGAVRHKCTVNHNYEYDGSLTCNHAVTAGDKNDRFPLFTV